MKLEVESKASSTSLYNFWDRLMDQQASKLRPQKLNFACYWLIALFESPQVQTTPLGQRTWAKPMNQMVPLACRGTDGPWD
uniref:Uncharacterized protein n=1 Tax=Salix viminalis TaxID=40686 RepID=A0A6N2NEW6_SALVM